MKIIRPVEITDAGAFTRNSTGTYQGMDGLIYTAAINEPRFNYSQTTGTYDLLMESLAQNLATYSEEFNQSAWTKTNATVTANSTASPNATVTADKLIETTANANHTIQSALTGIGGVVACSASVFVKAGTRTAFVLEISYSTTVAVSYLFDLTAGTLALYSITGGPTDYSAKIEPIGTAGWYRCSVSGSLGQDMAVMKLYLYNGSAISYTGATTNFLYIWGAQLEAQPQPTSYILTTTAAATRQADSNTAMMISNVAENDYAAYAAGTTYALAARVIYNHAIYESLQASNIGRTPDVSPTWWLAISATNRWKAFDVKVVDQVSRTNVIEYIITPGQIVDSLAILNIYGSSVEIVATDPTEGEVYLRVINLISTGNVIDGYTYCFNPITMSTDVSVTDIPPFSSASISIKVFSVGDTVRIGEVVIGAMFELGGTEYGPSIGIIDYSSKAVDAFGNYSVIERSYSKRISCNLFLDNSTVDEVMRQLSQYRAKPLVWVAADGFSSLIVYGFYRSFDITIPYPTQSACSLEIEGLT